MNTSGTNIDAIFTRELKRAVTTRDMVNDTPDNIAWLSYMPNRNTHKIHKSQQPRKKEHNEQYIKPHVILPKRRSSYHQVIKKLLYATSNAFPQ